MSKKREHKPENAQQQLKLGDRPPFISKRMHYVIQIVLVIVGVAFLRWMQYRRVRIDPQLKSDLLNASYSNYNPVNILI